MTPASIYQTQGPQPVDGPRKKIMKGQLGRKMVNKTIEIDGDLDTYQISLLSPHNAPN
jgi:hypothetical protein